MWYECKNDIIKLVLYIQPGAKSTEISGLHAGALKIKLNAPPIEGRANKVLKKFLAKCFNVPSKQVKLIHGEKSRNKIFEIHGSSIHPDELKLSP